jgi:hypothetical protein
MARYQHLPIYQTAYSLTREIYRLKIKFPKVLKNDLGELLCASSLRCIRCVIFANGSQKKIKPLQELLLEVETLWTFSRLAYDLQAISKGEFQVLSEKLSDLSKQVNAWHRWEKENLRPIIGLEKGENKVDL